MQQIRSVQVTVCVFPPFLHQTLQYLPIVNASCGVPLKTMLHLGFNSRWFERVSVSEETVPATSLLINHTFINQCLLLMFASQFLCRLRSSANRSSASGYRQKQRKVERPNNCGRLLWMAGQMPRLQQWILIKRRVDCYLDSRYYRTTSNEGYVFQ